MLTLIRNTKSAVVCAALVSLTCVLAALTVAPAAEAQSSLLVDNGPFATTSSWNITNFSLSDDFTVTAPVSVSTIRFWSMDFTESPNLSNFSGTMSWFIRANSVENRPGTTVASGFSSAVSTSDTGVAYSGSQYQIFQVDIPTNGLTLASGTYWLQLKEGNLSEPGDSSPIQWMVRDGRDGQAFRFDRDTVTPTAWASDGGTKDLAFQLLGSSPIESFETPEPGSIKLFLMLLLPLTAIFHARTLRRRDVLSNKTLEIMRGS